MAFLFLSVDAAFPFSHGGAADKGQGVRNRQNRTGGQMPALPLPTIRKRHTRGNANVKNPHLVWAEAKPIRRCLPILYQLLTAGCSIESSGFIIMRLR
jgi:hypothetical protein